jgi:hypothetical protein
MSAPGHQEEGHVAGAAFQITNTAAAAIFAIRWHEGGGMQGRLGVFVMSTPGDKDQQSERGRTCAVWLRLVVRLCLISQAEFQIDQSRGATA